LLRLEGVRASYRHIDALHGVSLNVGAAQLVALLGANGAGKTTLLRAVSGLIPVRAGVVRLNDEEISRLAPQEIVRRGVAHVPEGRQLIAPMSVLDNLRLGAYLRYRADRKGVIERSLSYVYELFPILREREQQFAGTLSGGEQQMLAIGRALMSAPRLLLLDEPSLGLAPRLVREIFEVLPKLRREGIAVLLVEQNVRMALAVADYAYVLDSGKVVSEGPTTTLSADNEIRRIYLGEFRQVTWEGDGSRGEG
jgi:branched-chain amino acid transport system ATP-binding protein